MPKCPRCTLDGFVIQFSKVPRSEAASRRIVRGTNFNGGEEMKLTREQVLHVAELAKLKLTEDEVTLFQEQLSVILAHAERLGELDTDAIPPTAAVLPLHNVFRPDVARESFPRDTMLANAPDVADGYVRVKAVLEGGR